MSIAKRLNLEVVLYGGNREKITGGGKGILVNKNIANDSIRETEDGLCHSADSEGDADDNQ